MLAQNMLARTRSLPTPLFSPIGLVLAGGVLAGSALAQTAKVPIARDAIPITGKVKHAGTYHVETGTWTRPRGQAMARGIADNIYSNTAPGGFFLPIVGTAGGSVRLVDSGGLPGLTNPGPFSTAPDREFYAVNEVTIGYCDFEPTPGSAGWQFGFIDSYAPCTAVTTPRDIRTVTGLPSNGCWTVTVAFDANIFPECMQADGGAANPGFNGSPVTDSFGFSLAYAGTGLAAAGPILAGDPANTDPGWTAGTLPTNGTGTYFGGTSNCPNSGTTGYLQQDQFFIEGTGCSVGTYIPGPTPCSPPASPWSGLFLELSASDSCNPVGPISQVGCIGAINQTGVPGEIQIFGNRIASQDNMRLVASNVPPGQFGLFLTGLAPLPGGTVALGNGFLCINPTILNGLGRFGALNQIRSIDASGEATLDTTAGDWTTTAVPTATGTYVAFRGTQAHFQFWHREPTGAGFNVTGSCSIIFQ